MAWGDQSAAAGMRDFLEETITRTIGRLRPNPRIGIVTSIDSARSSCSVLLQGSTESITVRYSPGNMPRSIGDIVRLGGGGGAEYWVTDVLSQGAGHARLDLSVPQPGMMMAFGGSAAPIGWLICNGTSYSGATYPSLFTVIGTTYGGSGGNFLVPDLRGRIALGAGSFATLGASEGASESGRGPNFNITIPSHTHSVPADSHTHGHSFSGGYVNHTTQINTNATGGSLRITHIDNDANGHSHPITGSVGSASGGGGTSGSGGGASSTGTMPYAGVNWIIKT